MDNKKIGNFICEQRKMHNITQNEFAAKLNVSEAEISEWENGISTPDVSLFSKVADLLNVTIDELINGERKNAVAKSLNSTGTSLVRSRRSKEEKCELAKRIALFSVTMTFLAGILASVIVDFAISEKLTWSLYPISSCVFSWLTIFPLLKGGLKKTYASLLVFSVLVIPFLYSLRLILHASDLFWILCLRTAVPSIIFLWIIFAIFKLLKNRKLLAAAITLFAAVPFNLLINFIVAKQIHTPVISIWNIIPIAILLFIAFTFLAFYSFMHKEKA